MCLCRAAIRNLAPALTSSKDRTRVLPWINKLFGAEYHVEVLRDKRNRYLAAITVNMINDELSGIFENDPPSGATRDLSTMTVVNAPCAEWEQDTTWSEYISALPENYEEMPCSFHKQDESCEKDQFEMNHQLDIEFWFLLYQIRPYAAMMPCPDARTKVASWIQTLCRLGCTKCGRMKGLRNDYAYALYGYVHDLRIAGPFQDYPPWNYLRSLPDAAKAAAKRHPLTSPCCEEAESFMSAQPTPEEGAFCYIAVTGEFANSNIPLPV
ncbi:uncharacterized protein LOC107266557 isoform X2 [Cephus cinctus]|uniref:Uncharacterized protein LOC107266557 isoform X2 n=1 Tax=Cephus cinctus TaxID=211228 RepID=A0AAJ7REW6_CEPCN|nr:uncharacterized protein LOC107266557 isoform X2 [Cephus cinctus]